ncbi:FAD binding domain protein [Colletotrichum tofieldiae]|nr:FAD binding domain protein [Colletotrichum tofieldiae]
MTATQTILKSNATPSDTAGTEPVETHFKSNQIVDGVLRYPPTDVKVIIVGGGIAGLFAAVECWRKGHDVVVVEKGDEISAHGKLLTDLQTENAATNFLGR